MPEVISVNNRWLKSDSVKLWLLVSTISAYGLFFGLTLLITLGASSGIGMSLLANLAPLFITCNFVFYLITLSALVLINVRFGFFNTVFSVICSSGLCLLVSRDVSIMSFYIVSLIPGFLMGYKSRTFSSPNSVLFWGMLPFLIPLILLILLYPELNSQLPQLIDEMHYVLSENAQALGISSAQMQLIISSMEKTLNWTLRLAPGILFTLFMSIVLFGYLGASAVSSHFGAILPRYKPLNLWKLSEFWLVPLGLSFLFILLGGSVLKPIGENTLFFMVHLYAFFGLCFVDFYFKRMNIPGPVRLVVYLFVMIVLVIVIPILAVIGVIDSRFDFRKNSQFVNKSIK